MHSQREKKLSFPLRGKEESLEQGEVESSRGREEPLGHQGWIWVEVLGCWPSDLIGSRCLGLVAVQFIGGSNEVERVTRSTEVGVTDELACRVHWGGVTKGRILWSTAVDSTSDHSDHALDGNVLQQTTMRL